MTVAQQPNNDLSAQDPKDVHLPEDKAPAATPGAPLRSDDIQISHAFRAAECHSRWLETQKAAEDEARKTARAAPKDVARSIMRIQRACRTPAPDHAVENILDAFERVKPLLPLIFQKKSFARFEESFARKGIEIKAVFCLGVITLLCILILDYRQEVSDSPSKVVLLQELAVAVRLGQSYQRLVLEGYPERIEELVQKEKEDLACSAGGLSAGVKYGLERVMPLKFQEAEFSGMNRMKTSQPLNIHFSTSPNIAACAGSVCGSLMISTAMKWCRNEIGR
ncbi:hypothetical protein FFLO_06825 [Filobasidium floriforme]|uniref:Uncharacterized protein n=1 Tax=Filobasidium floriforme TaxID=5210 RepID=A0A8K0NMH1_9TREE|nr:hypothetical protein FFLO_06825 [Filobasidium floriforme]